MPVAADSDAFDGDVVTGQIVLRPHSSIPERNAADRHIPAGNQSDKIGSLKLRAEKRFAVAVNRAFALDSDVLQVLPIYQAAFRIRVCAGAQFWRDPRIIPQVAAGA